MKAFIIATTLLLGAAPVAMAQTATPPAPAAAATAQAARYDLNTPIEKIVADPAAKAVLDKDLPSLTANPAFEAFKSMSLKDLQPMAAGALTDEKLAIVEKHLAELPQGQ